MLFQLNLDRSIPFLCNQGCLLRFMLLHRISYQNSRFQCNLRACIIKCEHGAVKISSQSGGSYNSSLHCLICIQPKIQFWHIALKKMVIFKILSLFCTKYSCDRHKRFILRIFLYITINHRNNFSHKISQDSSYVSVFVKRIRYPDNF